MTEDIVVLTKRKSFAVTDEVLKDHGPDVITQIQRQRLDEFFAGEKL